MSDNTLEINTEKGHAILQRVPDECPYCHRSIEAKPLGGWSGGPIAEGSESKLLIAFQCPNRQCKNIFITRYLHFKNRQFMGYLVERPTFVGPELPKAISDGFKDFAEIYNQALEAQHWGLSQIAGPGLRKALEFLIKDYVIRKKPDEVDKIKRLVLMQCIDQHVDDNRIQACASRAIWLGNDETHYHRRWKDKDIEHLKTLLKLTINWIENELLTEQFIEEMPSQTP